MDNNTNLRYWMIRHKSDSSICGIMIMENKKYAIESFAYVYNHDSTTIEAIEINEETLINTIGSDRMRKCITQSDPANYLKMNALQIKPEECTVYATECLEYECEASYLCQKCKINRRFGGGLGMHVYRLVYLPSEIGYKLEIIEI